MSLKRQKRKPGEGITLTPDEATLISVLLGEAAGTYGNHSCSDFWLSDHVSMSADDMRDLDRNIQEMSGEPEVHDPGGDHDHQEDWVLMSYFSEILEARKATP